MPDEISIAGFGGIPLGEKIYPELTTVAQDGVERARRALYCLERLKRGEPADCVRTLPVRLVVRDSVKERRSRPGDRKER